MKRLFIFGAGGEGREIAGMLPDHPDFGKKWELCGFLDQCKDFGDIPFRYPILGSEDTFAFRSDDLVILAIAGIEAKVRISRKLQNKIQFFTFIHPSCHVWDFADIGIGSVIYPGCMISTNVKIGNFVTINAGTQIGHDSRIGNYSSLMASVDLGGGVILGERVYMGTKSMVVPRKNIADGTQIAAGSVMMRSTKLDGCTWAGNPAIKFE